MIPFSSQEEPASSPAPPSSRGSQRIKKPPPITPRRFNKFFNPRSSGSSISSRAGQELRDITFNGANRRSSLSYDLNLDFDDLPNSRPNKRRKAGDSFRSPSPFPESSPPRSSPCQRLSSPRPDDGLALPLTSYRQSRICLPVRKVPYKETRPNWQCSTANFYSRSEDVHSFVYPALPFCVATCNTNSLVAIGDEDGGIRLLETAEGGKPGFDTAFLTFKPHNNAIMDLAFSSDDYLLATASGDQTARVVDMRTQTTVSILAGHRSSLKNVTFQPESDDIVATCCRDGIVLLWDLRCKGTIPMHRVETPLGDDQAARSCRPADEANVKYASITNSIMSAHSSFTPNSSNRVSRNRPDAAPTRGVASTTSLLFLPGSRSHLFLTASDGSAQLRLWDIRGKYTSKRTSLPPLPLAQTAPIQAHQGHRHFGISSLCISTDAARLYSVCKDNTVYVYSTNHLILGQAPQFDSARSRPGPGAGEQGLGPLYGLRHPSFHTSTFYVRAAIRKATPAHDELLALGSSDSCALVLPTDERHLTHTSHAAAQPTTPTSSQTLRDRHATSPALPVYEHGTPLVRGHAKEVTGVGWTSEGALVSVGDDYVARCWREDAAVARDLRIGGEREGRRHRCGWAEVREGWDDEDG